ncbi:MAG: YigZ family protein [Pseudoflavonifractor sp.]
MMEYLVPAGAGGGELVEKRSRFIGEVFPAETEAEARACIEAAGKRYHDARHHCWCFRLQDGTERYSDDGEPQGTAGQPMLNVFQRENITNFCCIVTRYFGGILLGAGGLVRAYSQSAKLALDGAGIAAMRPWTAIFLPCPYPFLERIKLELAAAQGVLGEIQYGAEVGIHALLPSDKVNGFTDRITELTAGTCGVQTGETVYRAGATG